MSTKDSGGSIFPTPRLLVQGEMIPESFGMSLRDKFAEAALPSELERALRIVADGTMETEEEWRAAVAARCYRMADAMLAERSKA